MNIENNAERYEKIKSLYKDWPKNAIMTSSTLKKQGISDQHIQRYCSSGWLTRIGAGGFVRNGEEPSWEGALYAIQSELDKPVHVGGLTALRIHGLAHYLELSSHKEIYLYNTTETKHKLPGWFAYFNKKQTFHYVQCHLFAEESGIKLEQVGGSDILVSQPERAILEALYLVPKQLSVEHASQLVENLQTIRPDVMQKLLESCQHILVKRLFLCLAELNQLPVIKHLDSKRIDLGSGERRIPPGGKYYAKYKLTLPYNGTDHLEENFDV